MIPLSGDLPKSKGIKSESVDSIDVTKGTSTLKRGFAHMLKNGVVMDVTTVEQAQIAEEAGAVSVMVLDKLPSDVRKAGGVARTASIRIIQDIMDSVTIPVMAKCRIGHVYEAKVLAEANVDMVDESEVLTPADENHHIWKWDFTTPFVNGASLLGNLCLLYSCNVHHNSVLQHVSKATLQGGCSLGYIDRIYTFRFYSL
jgi:pyridoxal 5'-phosphate synthase pdxS subunit